MLEEVVLLTVDEQTGKLRSPDRFGTAYALGGALFFDLALAGKIDTGTSEIEIVDAAPTGNAAMDYFLGEMAQKPERNTVRAWIQEAFGYRDYLEEVALGSLVERGVLRHEKSRKLWIIDVTRFPIVDNQQARDVRQRLANAILNDEIPEPRDIMLVSVADASGLWRTCCPKPISNGGANESACSRISKPSGARPPRPSAFSSRACAPRPTSVRTPRLEICWWTPGGRMVNPWWRHGEFVVNSWTPRGGFMDYLGSTGCRERDIST
jgi:Golgi phosphoprotein 3